ncbi:MAG TPA: hypothetical protein VGD79_13845 [Thermoanaerobaculia bacterium]|jgi:hypothetical protein
MRLSVVVLLLLSVVARADAPSVAFDPSPGPSWQCGASNSDFPGLAIERMSQPLVAGCRRGDAVAYAVITDLSKNRSVMRAEQMAGDAEDQLPSSWKLDSKTYDVVTLSSGSSAAYSKLTGRGDGFTFVSGNVPMVAISANVPLLFEDETGTPRQVIAVFRVRSPLPAGATARKEFIADLDRTLRGWAGTVRPASGRTITDKDFEFAAYARTKTTTTPAATTSDAPAPPASPGNRIAAATVAAVNRRATAQDLAILEDVAKRGPQTAYGHMAQTLLGQVRQEEQMQNLAATLEVAKEGAGDVFSIYLISAFESGDEAGFHAALQLAKQRGWTIRTASPAVLRTTARHRLPFTPSAEERTYFEVSAAEILPLVKTKPVRIDDIARRDHDAWRLKRPDPSKTWYLVQHEAGIGVLERQQSTNTYRYRAITNVLDLAPLDL